MLVCTSAVESCCNCGLNLISGRPVLFACTFPGVRHCVASSENPLPYYIVDHTANGAMPSTVVVTECRSQYLSDS
jgi:hypothetical protein